MWRYLDDGSDQLKSWREVDFDDGNWTEGKGELGFGDGGEKTLLRRGSRENPTITYYFRHRFTVSEESLAIKHFAILELLADDGAAVYINGKQVATVNLPKDPFYDELATATIGGKEEERYVAYRIDLDVIDPGENVIAVEVHQASLNSSDLSFDLRLVADEEKYGSRMKLKEFREGIFSQKIGDQSGNATIVLSRNGRNQGPSHVFHGGVSNNSAVSLTPQIDFRHAVADFDGNGIDELLFTWRNEILLRSIDAWGQPRMETFISPEGTNVQRACASGDRDGDLKQDAYILENWNGLVRVYCRRNMGNLMFEPPSLIAEIENTNWANNPAGLTTGDFNGDGRNDLLLYSRESSFVLVQNAEGLFDSPQKHSIRLDSVIQDHGGYNAHTGTSPPAALFRILDLNGDGRDDLMLPSGFHTASTIRAPFVHTYHPRCRPPTCYR